MKPLMQASAIALLFAAAALVPARAGAQPSWAYHAPHHAYWLPLPGYYGDPGSRGYPPPAYYGRLAPQHYPPRIPPGYDPERPARSGWRRGQVLPPDFRGAVVADYPRHHLRRPPRGYLWYRDADDYVLASATTGLIFEVIPGD
jgi:hypothetical protein